MRVLHTVFKVLFVLMGHPQVTSSHHRSIGFKTPGLILDGATPHRKAPQRTRGTVGIRWSSSGAAPLVSIKHPPKKNGPPVNYQSSGEIAYSKRLWFRSFATFASISWWLSNLSHMLNDRLPQKLRIDPTLDCWAVFPIRSFHICHKLIAFLFGGGGSG